MKKTASKKSNDKKASAKRLTVEDLANLRAGMIGPDGDGRGPRKVPMPGGDTQMIETYG